MKSIPTADSGQPDKCHTNFQIDELDTSEQVWCGGINVQFDPLETLLQQSFDQWTALDGSLACSDLFAEQMIQ